MMQTAAKKTVRGVLGVWSLVVWVPDLVRWKGVSLAFGLRSAACRHSTTGGKKRSVVQ